MSDTEASAASARVCSVCGRTPTDATDGLAWTFDASGGRESWVCSACSRDHVRAIEAKLEQEWW